MSPHVKRIRVLSFLVLMSASLSATELQTARMDAPWLAEEYLSLAVAESSLVRAYRLEMPRGAPALPGRIGAWQLDLRRVVTGPAILRLRVSDDFRFRGQGHIFARIRVGNDLLWQADVGTIRSEILSLPVRADQIAAAPITFEGFVNRQIDNFGVRIEFADLQLSMDGGFTFGSVSLVDSQSLPEPIEALPAVREADVRVLPDWLDESRALQPWGRSQKRLFENMDYWIPQLRDRYGFNTVVLAPPDGHRGIVRNRETDVISDEDFGLGITKLRAAGFRVLFYASLVHMGHASEWHEDFGEGATKLPNRFPKWLQRTADGQTINRYGGRWLSPLTPALDYQKEYFRTLITTWQPDGLMLDNHGLHFAGRPDQLTGHEGIAAEQYRFFAETISLEKQWHELPGSPRDPHYRLWLEWRNRALADATANFRSAMRSVSPSILVSANVAFDYANPALANDYLTNHLDVIVTENKATTPAQLHAKISFGRALSDGAPQWSYMGTFESRQPDRLAPPEFIEAQFSAGMATGALPWVVFYGFDDSADNSASLAAMSEQMRRWQYLQRLKPWGEPVSPVVTVVSTRERSFTGGPAIPLHATGSAAAGYSLRMVRIDDLAADLAIGGVEAIVLEDIRSMSRAEAAEILRFVQKGGVVISTRESGWRDLLGRWRASGLLTGVSDDAGKVHFVDSSEAILPKLSELVRAPMESTVPLQWSQIYNDGAEGFWVHLALEETVETPEVKLKFSARYGAYEVQRVCFATESLVPVAAGGTAEPITLDGKNRYHLLHLKPTKPKP
jgi:hypothetical protein